MGVAYALGSLAFAGLNDFFFKLYIGPSGRRLGPFVAVTGFVWAGFYLVTMRFQWSLDATGWGLSLAAGLASLIGNLLLVESMRHLPVGVCATVYRLNLALVMVLAFWLLAEPVTPLKLLGLVFAIAAVLLLYQPNGPGKEDGKRKIAYGLLAAATCCRAAMGLLYKVAEDVPQADFLCVSGLCWLFGGLLYTLIRREPLLPERPAVGFGVLSGMAIVGLVYFLSQATRFGEASIVVPISQLSFVMTVFLGWLFLKEALTNRKLAALGLASGCVVALAFA